MTEWTPNVEAYEALDDASALTRPVPRMIRRSGLHHAPSRRALYADAREEARLVRGRDAFVWKGRVIPIGIPIAAAAGVLAWRRRRSARDTLFTLAGVGVMSYLEARAEWSVRRRACRYRQRNPDR
ncbi:MAG TPA: hypothetical protein VFD67_13080 [Gemmatimonadaceae bacterium]|nr:hypothetical protein [Gemmatimonadaceae bacterium]